MRHPSEVVSVGQEIEAKVLKFDQEKRRVSLGLKQLGEDPWIGSARRYPQNTRLFGKVTNITDYGAFVEIETGIEGLVHVSEMDWTNKNVDPKKIVQLGEEVEVMVLDIDEDRRRISLGMKQCKAHPWEEFNQSFKKGDKVITGGGIYGKVVKAEAGGMELVVEIADGLNVTVIRATIRDVVNEENFKPAKIETKPAKNKAAKPANSNAQEKHKKYFIKRL